MEITQILIPVAIVGAIGLVAGLLLAYASKRFEVKLDPRVTEVRNVLPGANCGACGFSGCDAYAAGVVLKGAKVDLCTVGGTRTAGMLGRIMGVVVEEKAPMKARVMCKGTWERSVQKYRYKGIGSCEAAALLYAGPGECPFGCEGYGDCVRVCQFDAIHIEKGVAVVDEAKCTACGLCVARCPKKIIRLAPAGVKATIRCSNHDRGAQARKYCSVTCISCGRCVRACPTGAIAIDNMLAVIDYSKCIDCGECAKICPTRACDGGVIG